jgi:predicted nuclease of predicted toxin-antitoxin system
MNLKFLIDVNLPYYFSLWNSKEFIHQFDLGDDWPDEKIWEYAKTNDLTIVTKDSDFSNRILLKLPPPKVVHIKFGNKKMKEFFNIINTSWPQVVELNKDFKLINIFEDRLEAIN